MGNIHLDLGDNESAQASMEAALRRSRKNSGKGWEGLALVGLGRVFGKKKLLAGEDSGGIGETLM
jgi:hypothetical protein